MNKNEMLDDGLLKTYFEQINTVPLLSFEEELELSKRIQQGDTAARERLINANLRLVVKIAHAFLTDGVSFMDIIQEGNSGLIQAAERYDYRQNVRFSTYSNWWIKQAIRRYLFNKQRFIRLPTRKEELYKRIKAECQALAQELMRQATVEEVAASMNMPVAEVARIISIANETLSLDSEFDDYENGSALDVFEDNTYNPEQEFIRKTSKETARHFLRGLDRKERIILMYRFQFNPDEPHTLKGISARLGISPETVRQIEIRALRNLRRQAAAEAEKSA